jgi:hypothetical protein
MSIGLAAARAALRMYVESACPAAAAAAATLSSSPRANRTDTTDEPADE